MSTYSDPSHIGRPTKSALIIYPPLTDPTAPYHSSIYVASHARSNGFPQTFVKDANIDALHFCASDRYLAKRLARWSKRRELLSEKACLTRMEQLEYLHLTRSQALKSTTAATAISALQDKHRFFNYREYRASIAALSLWIECLSNDGFPGQFNRDFTLSNHNVFNLSSVDDLTNSEVLQKITEPFEEYFSEVLLPEVLANKFDLIGFSVTYTSQLPFSLWLLHKFKSAYPNAYYVCGGTEISGVWKYARTLDIFEQIFCNADACVVGEGETAFVRLMEFISGQRTAEDIPNTIFIRGGGESKRRPPLPLSIRYEDPKRHTTPDYTLLDNTKYLSPYVLVYYSPTRGCYWNKCTFCDYGLNFGTPTSPWRQRGLDEVLNDLKAITAVAKYVYISVDVLAPAAVLKLAQGIVEAQINIRWAAEMRIEPYFNFERCKLLRKSGCVAVSVGFESGSQRILDLIKKGTKLADIETTIGNFARAGIAVQMMGFTGFPGESDEEARATFEFLDRTRDDWTVAAIGEFVLTPGSIVAQHPANFGLHTEPSSGDDVVRSLTFRGPTSPARDGSSLQRLSSLRQRSRTAEFGRPFAGGIDTPHSIFVYDKLGSRFPGSAADRYLSWGVRGGTDVAYLCGRIELFDSFDLAFLFGGRDLRELRREFSLRAGESCDVAGLRRSLNSTEKRMFKTAAPVPVFVRDDGAIIPISGETARILNEVDSKKTWQEVLDAAATGMSSDPEKMAMFANAICDAGMVARVERTT